MIRTLISFSCLAILLSQLSAANGANIVAPISSTSTAGNAQGPAPLRFYGSGGSRTQQVYDSSDFAGLTGPITITAISFRPFTTPGAFSSNSVNISDTLIQLSTTAASGEGANPLSTTFASNVGGNAKTVYSGALTLTTAASGNAPYPFDYTINLQTPFTYNPAQGNLLLDLQIPTTATVSGAGFGFATFDTVNTASDGVYSVLDNSNGGATTGTASTAGAITQFTYTSSVPEPSSVLLAFVGIVVLPQFAARRRS